MLMAIPERENESEESGIYGPRKHGNWKINVDKRITKKRVTEAPYGRTPSQYDVM